MMEAVRTSETSANFNETTRRYIPEDCHFLGFYLLTLLNNSISFVESSDVISELRSGRDVEGSGRGLIHVTVSAVAWTDWGEQRRTSVRVVSLWVEIWTPG
jgi:hypothetical protein